MPQAQKTRRSNSHRLDVLGERTSTQLSTDALPFVVPDLICLAIERTQVPSDNVSSGMESLMPFSGRSATVCDLPANGG